MTTIKWTKEDEARWQRFTGGRSGYGTDASVRSRHGPTRLDLAYTMLGSACQAMLLVWLVGGLFVVEKIVTGQTPIAAFLSALQ